MSLNKRAHVFPTESDSSVFSQYAEINTWTVVKSTFSDNVEQKSFMSWLSYRPQDGENTTEYTQTQTTGPLAEVY